MRRIARTVAISTVVLVGAGVPAVAGLGSPDGVGPASRAVVAEVSGADTLAATLDAAAPDDLLPVIVHAASAEVARDAVAVSGLTLVESYDRIGAVAAVGTPAAVRAATVVPGVVSVEDAGAPLRFDLDTSHEATRGAEAVAGYDATRVETYEEVLPKKRWKDGTAHPKKTKTVTRTRTVTEHVQVDGSGVSIAVVDSGVDGEHPFFQRPDGSSKVVRNLEFLCHDLLTVPTDDPRAVQQCMLDVPYTQTDTTSVGGHGTHVAGIAAGAITSLSDGRTLMGAAPGADLISLSVGVGLNVFGATSAFAWILDHHDDPCGDGSCPPIRVVNASFGPDPDDYNPDLAVSKLADELVADGVVVVFAASNDGGDGSTNMVSPYAQSPTPGVISVANYDDQGTGTRDGGLDPSSSRGEIGRPATYPDVAAPGANILSSCRPYLPVCSTGFATGEVVENGDYNTISGTSMATPHIAGIVALLVEADPTLSPAEIEDILEDTAYKFSFGGPYEADLAERNPDDATSFDKGHGLVDVVAALDRILDLTAPGAAQRCVADGPVITDAAGDANTVLGASAPRPSEPGLDILDGVVTEQPDGTLAWTLRVTDLTEAGPQAASGDYFDWNFEYAGSEYYLGLGWTRGEEPRFLLGYFDTTRTTLADLEGWYDVEAETVTAIVPLTVFADNREGAPVVEPGSVFAKHQIVARYDLGAVVPDADTADGVCPYTVGLGAVPPVVDDEPVDEPAEPADGSLSPDSPTFTATGEPGTAAEEPLLGTGIGVTTDQFTKYVIDVEPAGTGTVTVDLTSDVSEVNDVDLYVFDEQGVEVVRSAEPSGVESVTFDVTGPRRFTLVVRRFLTLEAGYQLVASLH